jgi:hypothetical protein
MAKYRTIYRDRLTNKFVSKRKWKANSKARYLGGAAKRYVKQRIHLREEGNFRYIIRKQTPKGRFRGTQWKESKVEVSITSDHKLSREQLESLGGSIGRGEEIPDGIEVTLVEWTTGRKTKSYSSESDAETGFSRFSQFFSEEIK